MEIIDIGLNDLEPINISLDDIGGSSSSSNSGSVNFGPGIELLMNEKKKSASNSTSIDLGELDKLEDELNQLSSQNESGTKSLSGLNGFGGFSGFSGFSDMFGSSSNGSKDAKKNVDDLNTDSNLGQATSDSMGNTKTWDGFSKIGEVPQSQSSSTRPLSDREKRRKKRAMLQKLQEWYEKGQIKNSSHFTMDSNYEEIEDEYETALEDKRKKDSIKLQQWWFMTFVNSLEYANSAFNPFDINLDGWGEQVSEDIDSYDEIFSELHDKYKGGKLSPEISLLLRLGFSAAVVNFTNKALSTATPAFNDVIKQSPELMRMFTNATVNSMSNSSPGFAFANNIVNEGSSDRGQGPPRNMGPPPAPVETKNIPPPPRPGQMQFTERPSSRPDIAMGRGAMFKEGGVDMSSPYENPNAQFRGPSTLPPSTLPPSSYQPQSQSRAEMRGPQNTDIDNILSGLKTKTVDIHSPSPMNNGDDSMISISSLKDMQGASIPKKSNRRKNVSNKNTISLDI
jgi:hypothetical protein